MAKQFMFDEEGRRKIQAGIAKLAGAVKVTLGPSGKNVIIQKSFGSPVATKDGVTVSKEVELEDPFENMGAKIVNEAASKTADKAGDGTTTSVILAEAMFQEGLKYLAGGVNAMALRRGIESAARTAAEAVRKLSRPVKSKEDFRHVATIAAHHDDELGSIVADAMDRAGKEGVITVEEGKTTRLELEFVDGMQFDKGYVSPYFVTNPDDLTAVLEDAFVLIYEKKLSNIREIVPILEKVIQTGRPILILCEDLEGEALATLVINKLRGTFKCCAVKAPAFGDRRKAVLEDIAVLTGGKFVTEELGMKLEKITLEDLGRAQRITVEKEKCTIVGGAGERKTIDARIQQLRAQIKQSTSDYDREKLEERLAKLAGGVALLRVGALTEAEMKERKDRADDAVCASKAAREEGIVPGGGVALLRAKAAVDALRLEGDEACGPKIVAYALTRPARQIAENLGENGSVIVEQILALPATQGFDARGRRFTDMFEAGIVDATKVACTALLNAASVAGLALTSHALITELKEKQEPVGGSVR